MAYTMVIKKVAQPQLHEADKAADSLARDLKSQATLGWKPAGGRAGTAPHVPEAMVERR
ncbi:MAG: hypothetical protein JNL92_20400 [Opitutaceae bacterium]|nr:hypothetical protein [Opitutaceae bacterium]